MSSKKGKHNRHRLSRSSLQNPFNSKISASSERGLEESEVEEHIPQSRLQFGTRHMKRKSTSGDGIQVPSRKQLITEERMAACMQRLSLKHADKGTSSLSSQKNRSDDSDFEDYDDTQPDFDLDLNTDEKLPVIEFAPGMKETFQNMRPILPDVILEKFVNKPCLALVPYVPPVDVALNLILQSGGMNKVTLTFGMSTEDNSQPVAKKRKEDKKKNIWQYDLSYFKDFNSHATTNSPVENEESMTDETFTVEWDSDCDDDFLLD